MVDLWVKVLGSSLIGAAGAYAITGNVRAAMGGFAISAIMLLAIETTFLFLSRKSEGEKS